MINATLYTHPPLNVLKNLKLLYQTINLNYIKIIDHIN